MADLGRAERENAERALHLIQTSLDCCEDFSGAHFCQDEIDAMRVVCAALAAAREERDAAIAKLTDERRHHAAQYLDSSTAAFNARNGMVAQFEKWLGSKEWSPDEDIHMEFRALRHLAEKLREERQA